MAELTENRKSDIRVGSRTKGKDFFLGKRTYTNTLDMVSVGLSQKKSMRFAEKFLEAYGENLVRALENLSKKELTDRGFDPGISSKLQRKFGYFVEKKTIYTLYVYLEYNDEWAPWARYIMGKTGNEVHKKSGANNGFRMSHLTDSYFNNHIKAKPRRSRGWGKTYRGKEVSERTKKKREGKQNTPKTHKHSRYIVPFKKKGSDEVVFRSLPIGGSGGGTWIHPAVCRFNFIDKSFKEVDILMEKMLAEQKRKYYEKLRLK